MLSLFVYLLYQDLESRISQLTSSLELVTREKEEALGQMTALASNPTQGTTRQDGEAMGRALREKPSTQERGMTSSL